MQTASPNYARKLDDDLLQLALDPDSLTPEARAALSRELKSRHLDSPRLLEEFAEEQKVYRHLDDLDLGKLGLGPRGMGKRLYGKSNVELVGLREEYDATTFAVIAYFPLVPMGTYRISGEQGSKQFVVLDKKTLDWSQIAWVWVRAAAIAAAIPFALDLFLRAIHH